MNRRTFLSSTMFAGLFAWLPGKAKAVQEEKYPYEFPYVSPELRKPPTDYIDANRILTEMIMETYAAWLKGTTFTNSTDENRNMVKTFIHNLAINIPNCSLSVESERIETSILRGDFQFIRVVIVFDGDPTVRTMYTSIKRVDTEPKISDKVYLTQRVSIDLKPTLVYVKGRI